MKELGINIQMLAPGQPNCMYHAKNAQEDFLVLFGEGLLLVEGEERPLSSGTSFTARPGRNTSSSAPAIAPAGS